MPLKRSEESERRSAEVAHALEQLLLATLKDSFEELESKFKALEQRLLREVVKTAFERREMQRRFAETVFTEAFARNCPWPVFGRALRRIHRLGYSHVERRYHVACLYAQWCHDHPEHNRRQARRLLNETEWRLKRLPREDRQRLGLLKRLGELRARAGFLETQ